MAYTYTTKFILTNPVNDFEAACEYLSEDKMVNYFKEDSRISEELANKVESIDWQLFTAYRGIIKVVTNELLTDKESKVVSDWILGQNSDGIGESFEQQDFAECIDEDSEDDWGNCERDFASFDWETNDYKLTLVE